MELNALNSESDDLIWNEANECKSSGLETLKGPRALKAEQTWHKMKL